MSKPDSCALIFRDRSLCSHSIGCESGSPGTTSNREQQSEFRLDFPLQPAQRALRPALLPRSTQRIVLRLVCMYCQTFERRQIRLLGHTDLNPTRLIEPVLREMAGDSPPARPVGFSNIQARLAAPEDVYAMLVAYVLHIPSSEVVLFLVSIPAFRSLILPVLSLLDPLIELMPCETRGQIIRDYFQKPGDRLLPSLLRELGRLSWPWRTKHMTKPV